MDTGLPPGKARNFGMCEVLQAAAELVPTPTSNLMTRTANEEQPEEIENAESAGLAMTRVV